MVAKPFGASFGTTWSPPKDEEGELASEGSIPMDSEGEGESGGDGEG